MNGKIILFDGYCDFCSFCINFIVKKDRKKLFKFAILQTGNGGDLKEIMNLVENPSESVILIDDSGYYTKSNACLNIIKYLSSPIKILYIFMIIPVSVRDFIYDIAAKNRYFISRKKRDCRIPAESGKNSSIT